MPMQKCDIQVNRAKKEIRPHGTLEFPCAGYSDLYTGFPWHWHEEFEVIHITEHTLTLMLPGKTFLVSPGDIIFINSNTLHYGTAVPPCTLQSLVFDPALITGSKDSAFAKKYISPLISTSFYGYLWKADEHEDIVEAFTSAFDALSLDAPGYEFIVRENLSRICFLLYQEMKETLTTGEPRANQDDIRIRKMLDYIHTHFAADISLADIARTADIGEREALRCFARNIQLSPMQYLLKYRIMQGADFLRQQPERSISEIAGLSGFDSPSNFSKMFRRFYGCTPKEYRNSSLK